MQQVSLLSPWKGGVGFEEDFWSDSSTGHCGMARLLLCLWAYMA